MEGTLEAKTLYGLEIVATEVSDEDYMEQYAESRHEWVEGIVLKMSPVSMKHYEIAIYVLDLLRAFLSVAGIPAKTVQAPFVMRLDAVNSRREPDLMVILGENLANLKDTYMNGPADICIEIVSPGTDKNDYGAKLVEYEKGGVQEYWILDPIRKDTRFLRLNSERVYQSVTLDGEGNHATPLLPGLKLHVPTLWQEQLPDISAILAHVQDLLKD